MMLISGFRGWIGSALVEELQLRAIAWRGVSRTEIQTQLFQAKASSVANTTAIHLAAIAHIPVGLTQENEYHQANCEHAIRFAQLCQRTGVRRFIFVSSAKVLGEFTEEIANEQSTCTPPDAYSTAKLQAETALLGMHRPGEFEVTVLRPPLVYGPGVKANFLQLLGAANSAIPLPASSNTKRSMVYLGNLIDALIYLGKPQSPSGAIWFVKDPQDLSMAQFLSQLRMALGRRAPILALPLRPNAFSRRLLANTPLLANAGQRLLNSLQIDDAKLRASGWSAPFTTAQGLTHTAQWYLSQCQRPSL
jgi:nucleoside-diphosphate-sugar epimerase